MDRVFLGLAGILLGISLGKSQNCKQLFMYINNWNKGVALAICPFIFGNGEYSTSAKVFTFADKESFSIESGPHS